MADKFRGEDSSRQARRRICGTIWMDTATEDMWEGNRRDTGQRRWLNELEGRQRTRRISTGKEYQPEGVSSLLDNGDFRQGQR